jgi:8-oxo-dGTP pyrophosphatase MutT (NUDIX family)
LIERPVYDGAHSGQISFPGGKMEPDDKDLLFTALRECQEEIGIEAARIQVLGSLSPLYIPVSKFEVYPVVGYLSEEPVFIPQTKEVVSILEVPVTRILEADVIEYRTVHYNGKEESIPYFNIQNKFVWGATAMILSEFVQVIKEC